MDMVRSNGVCLPIAKYRVALLHEIRCNKEALKSQGICTNHRRRDAKQTASLTG